MTARTACPPQHPTKRESRDHYRPPPNRLTERMAAWRREHPFRVNSAVLWEGPSRLDGKPIVVIASNLRRQATVNVKTGDMVQLYILPLYTNPRQAIDTGEDRSVCGTCPHRPLGKLADCYVTVAWAPSGMHRSYWRGNMPRITAAELVGAAVRFGAWGDPAAVPLEVWRPIVEGASTHTGYTQEWPRLDVAEWGWLMASVASPVWRDRAHARGWRTFRVVYDDAPEVGERECLATAHGITCVACGGCAGNADPRPTSFWIRAHGYRMGRPPGGSP